jgi:hypothetical protein
MKRLVFPPHESTVTLHSSLLTICEENRCAALLLDVLISHIQKTAAEGDDPWLHIGQAQLYDDILHLAGEKAISQSLQLLERKGYIAIRNPQQPWDHTREYAVQFEAIQQAIDEGDREGRAEQ